MADFCAVDIDLKTYSDFIHESLSNQYALPKPNLSASSFIALNKRGNSFDLNPDGLPGIALSLSFLPVTLGSSTIPKVTVATGLPSSLLISPLLPNSFEKKYSGIRKSMFKGYILELRLG